MEAYLPISYLNDFIFCPRSIYFHQLYGRVRKEVYQTTDQVQGAAAHRTIDNQSYSTAKTVLQGMEVYSAKYRIGGKIDIFDQSDGALVERKKKIKTIYDGYVYQLYAQYHCLTEMGYRVKQLKLYSMDDNKSYPVKKPEDDPECQQAFEVLVNQMRRFELTSSFSPNVNKCLHCIYRNFCDVCPC